MQSMVERIARARAREIALETPLNPARGLSVLAGFAVPESDADDFERYLEDLAYPYVDETENAAYRAFLR